MGSWLVAWLVTPIFGLSLQLQAPDALHAPSAALLSAATSSGAGSAAGMLGTPALLEAPAAASIAPYSVALEVEGAADPQQEYAEQLRRRASLTKIHRALGIATWSAMTATVVAGFIQYYNLYGFFADQGSNPCVKGEAIFGQGQCSGTPWPHAIMGFATAGLYTSTLAVSMLMPDPDDLSSGDSEFARTLRMHKILRWVHLGGMIAQVGLGMVIANNWLGLDRANDYRTLQALSTVHTGLGLVTWGSLSWAAALMLF